MKRIKNIIGNYIPLVDLSLRSYNIHNQIRRSINRVLQSGWYILGKELEQFEREFADYLKVRFAVGVASGTDALTISLKALGLKKTDDVIIPANVYPSVFGVAHSGVKIRLADVDSKTLNICRKTITQVLTPHTKAILAVHLYGNPVNLDEITKLTKKKSIFLIEDCSHAIGAEYKGKKVGVFGDVSCFSFYPTKNLGALGDGGMIVTNDSEIYKKLKLWRMYGEDGRYQSVLVGHNSRLDEIQAAILRLKLPYLDVWNQRRITLAEIYKKNLKNLSFGLLSETAKSKHVYHLFVIRVKNREKLVEFLKGQGIQTAIHYPIPIHLLPSFAYLKYQKGDFPITEKASKEIISLPIYPNMKMKSLKYIIDSLIKFDK